MVLKIIWSTVFDYIYALCSIPSAFCARFYLRSVLDLASQVGPRSVPDEVARNAIPVAVYEKAVCPGGGDYDGV